jgi:hypothetical protein
VIKIPYITITICFDPELSKNPVSDTATILPLGSGIFGIAGFGRKK